MTKKIRIALVGHGGWGKQHARIFAARDDVEFCALVGHNPERLHASCAAFGVRGYLDVATMLAQETPDLVSVALPNLEHFEITLAIIHAGYNVIIEKPLVFELAQADQLLEAVSKHKVFAGIVFNHRYAQPVQMAKRAICSGEIGEITFLLWRFGGDWQPDHPHMALIESQCHGFDMIEFLAGPIHSVSAALSNKTGHGYRSLALALELENGAVGSMVGGYDSSFAYKMSQLLEINGTRGRILVEDTVQRFTLQQAGEETRTVWEAGYFNDTDRQFHHTLDRYMEVTLKAFRQGSPPPVPLTCGRRALQLGLAAIDSFTTGRRICIPLPQDSIPLE